MPRVTSDAKHVEIGLTDKADSARWVFAELGRRGIGPGLVLVAGDEFGPLGGLPRQRLAAARTRGLARATAVSVGAEPTGAPAGGACAGRAGGLSACSTTSCERRRRRDVPELDGDPAWTLASKGSTRGSSGCTSRCSHSPTAGSGTRRARSSTTATRRRASLLAGVYDGRGPGTELQRARTGRACPGAAPTAAVPRRLDLRTGLLREEGRAEVASLLLARAARHRRASRAAARP